MMLNFKSYLVVILDADYKYFPSSPAGDLGGFNEKGTCCINAENPFFRPHGRKSICDSRASILMLRQLHSFPYSGELYISFFKKRVKLTIFFRFSREKTSI